MRRSPQGAGEHLLPALAIEAAVDSTARVITSELDMNVAATYGIRWDVAKCGRDAFQNFFDANGCTLDGISTEVIEHTEDNDDTSHRLYISGGMAYDYRDLTVIGATTKSIGEHTAGGFGEGAKFLALSLLRDHNVDQVVFRSGEWQLEFFIDKMAADRVARPTDGLHARIAKGLPHFEGSTLLISSRDKKVIDELESTRKLFRSSENPDFQNMTVETTLPDGTQVGVKYLGFTSDKQNRTLPRKGRVYIAGQCRHYSTYGARSAGDNAHVDEWANMSGMTVYTTKDISAGDRDRGVVGRDEVVVNLFQPLADNMTSAQIATFISGIEPAYEKLKEIPDLYSLSNRIISAASAKQMSLPFDEKYIAVTAVRSEDREGVIQLIKQAGKIPCDSIFSQIGMSDDSEFIRKLHIHTELSPRAEQLVRIGLLEEALSYLSPANSLPFSTKPIKLYSQTKEKSPAHGSFGYDTVWLAVEHLDRSTLHGAIATVLHENDHTAGGDHTASFSYQLTATIDKILQGILQNPDLYKQLHTLNEQWIESQARDSQDILGGSFKLPQPWTIGASQTTSNGLSEKYVGLRDFYDNNPLRNEMPQMTTHELPYFRP
jgi:hypothetical protein